MNANSNIEMAATYFKPEVRADIRANPRQYAIDNGIIPADSSIEIKLVACQSKQMFIPVMRNIGDQFMSNDQLKDISAGVKLGSLGTAGSAGSIMCICTCASSIGSVGSAGTAGCVD